MANKAAIPVVLGLGALALILWTSKAQAAPSPELPEIPSEKIPTVSDIMAADSIAELNAWYNLINELFILGEIDHDTYTNLYDAYYNRWYELV